MTDLTRPPYRTAEKHVHDWVEGPDQHSVCRLCGDPYSPIVKVADLQRRIDNALSLIQSIDPTSGRARMSTFLNDLRNLLDPPSGNAPRREDQS